MQLDDPGADGRLVGWRLADSGTVTCKRIGASRKLAFLRLGTRGWVLKTGELNKWGLVDWGVNKGVLTKSQSHSGNKLQ